jgi:hypothetical protein
MEDKALKSRLPTTNLKKDSNKSVIFNEATKTGVLNRTDEISMNYM